MKALIFFLSLLAVTTVASSQMETIQLNTSRLQFDNGRELPAEKTFFITADAGPTAALVKMQVSSQDFSNNKILYQSVWRRKDNDVTSSAILPNHYKLKSGNEYYFRFLYYRAVQETEYSQLKEMLRKTARSLLESNVQVKDDRYNFLQGPADLFASLNDVIEEGMVNYETRQGVKQPAFSGVVKNMLQALAKQKRQGSEMGNASDNSLSAVLTQVNNEIEMMGNEYRYVLNETIVIPDYPVEKKTATLALNVGYGGIYNSGDFSNVNYFSGPYAGISFPLGNRVFSGSFWNNSSISAGLFLKNFTASNANKISGPVVNKPLYVAYGYRIFRYLKLHAGAAVLEETNKITSNRSVYLKPFVGLSLELNLWLGVNNK